MTAEARSFSVTADPTHLEAYWHEVDVYKHRDKAISLLKKLSDDPKEVSLLVKSKKNSDALILTEVRSMKLVLDAYHVPTSLLPSVVARYALSKQDAMKTPEQKIRLAQTIMFDKQYFMDKNKIMGPIIEFNKVLRIRAQQYYKMNRDKLSFIMIFLFINILTMLALILLIVWLRRGLN